ncbi:DNA internalization-related competence protein ComEC/Rec2 [Bacillus sp. PS06]|uniref:DNA internalization-related competence protein ComEC/Rec2 n=1 Tax=Bacillus sp. PS06 TaxID=2764176 RepID=UPI00177ECE3A|nr:DNA internalization-related competence protein ComEC/Rec2 [Bacillus sp. PS06]MBD8069217.1 DNA internalization-related competence protein ComEC/Rec2 [Bacillus sp. PS06]
MNKLINYLHHIYKQVSHVAYLLKGQHVYLSLSAIIGILIPYHELHLFILTAAGLYLCYILLQKQLLIFLLSLITIIGFWYLYLENVDNNQTTLASTTSDFSFEIISPVHIDGDKLTTTVRTSTEKLQLNYYVNSLQQRDELSFLTVGDQCKLSGELTAPSPAKNPNSFDYQQYLNRKEIHWILVPTNWLVTECRKGEEKGITSVLQLREQGIRKVGSIYPDDVKGIIQALLFGERKQIEEEILLGYQSLGVVHLLAISGLHVGFITSMLFYLLIRLGISRERSIFLLLLFLPFYVVIAGASPSVLRACLMTGLVLISAKSKHRFSSLDAISIACGLLLMNHPFLLFEVGFQLSFIVSFSLIMSSNMILKQGSVIMSLIKVSMIAQISGLPVVLFNFYEISLISLPLNILFVPLYSLVFLPLTITSFVTSCLFEPLGMVPSFILIHLLRYTNNFTIWVNEHANISLTFGRPNLFILIFYILSLFYLFISWERQKKLYQAVTLFALVCIFHYISPYLNPYGEVTIIDIGQGDTIYIELPYRKKIYLIDAAEIVRFERESWRKRESTFSVSNDVIVPFLKSKGVRSIDQLIITHGDYDHMGGAIDLMEQIHTKNLMLGEGNSEKEIEKDLISYANNQSIKINTVGTGDWWLVDDYSFYILSPDGSKSNANNQSIVIYTELGGVRWLFTGDLEVEGERALVSRFPKLEVDILKVGHHGSNTSTTAPFLDQLNPKIGLISVGENNRYNHPHPELINRLKSANMKIYRTDLNGAITFRFTKKKGTFSVMIP